MVMRQVQVRDWGSGDPGDLGELRVASVSSSSPSATAPLYQELARRLETLEARVATVLSVFNRPSRGTCQRSWHEAPAS